MCEMSDLFLSDVAVESDCFAVGVGNFRSGTFDFSSSYPATWQKTYFDSGWASHDPVIAACSGRDRQFTWDVDSSAGNKVMTGAADYGLLRGTSCSSLIGGSSCIITLAGTKLLGGSAVNVLHSHIRKMHIRHLANKALDLSDDQRELMTLFAHGFRAKQVAHEFQISEEGIKMRKKRILDLIGVSSFSTAVHVCAVAGVTVH